MRSPAGSTIRRLRCRALVLQAAVMLQRGDLQGAVALTTEADPYAEAADDDGARAELAAVNGQLNFFAGSYPESLAQAERAIALSDRVGSLPLRVFTRRCACVVFGNIGVSDWHGKLQEVLELAIEAGQPVGGGDVAQRPRAPDHGAGPSRRGRARHRPRDGDRRAARPAQHVRARRAELHALGGPAAGRPGRGRRSRTRRPRSTC